MHQTYKKLKNGFFGLFISSVKFLFSEILNFILAGRMGEAIELTNKLYPGLLEKDSNLLFALKCRQFVEMVNGTDCEVFQNSTDNQTSVIQSTKHFKKSNMNQNFEEWNHNCKNEEGSQFHLNGQLEEDVDMEDSTSSNLNSLNNSVASEKNNSNSNGFKHHSVDETMGMYNIIQ